MRIQAIGIAHVRDADRLWLIVNSASGSYDEPAVSELQVFLSSHRSAPHRTIDCQESELPGSAELHAAGVGCLLVYTGDGTLSRYLGRLEKEGWKGKVLPLPGGTKNLLCHAMFGDLTTVEIVTLFADMELKPTNRNCIRCGQHTALMEVLLGPEARSAEVREALREKELSDLFRKSAEIANDAATGPTVHLVEPRRGREEGYPGLYFSILDNALSARGYLLDTLTDWLRQSVAIATRDFREGPFDDLGLMNYARCQSEEKTAIDAMIDGEAESAASQITLAIDRFDLRLLSLRND